MHEKTSASRRGRSGEGPRRRALLAHAAGMVLVACGGAAAPPATADAVADRAGTADRNGASARGALRLAAPPAADGARAWVWGLEIGDEGAAQTVELVRDGGAWREVEAYAGVRVAVGPHLFEAEFTSAEVGTSRCPEDMGGFEGEPGTAVGLTLRAVEGSARPQQVVRPPKQTDANGYEASVQLVASLGPLLFYRVSEWTYSCGAHGSAAGTSEVWDMSAGAPAEHLGWPDPPPTLVAAAEDELRALLASDTAGDDAVDASFVELRPGLSPGGNELIAYWSFTTFACYVCGASPWGSYSVAATVEGPRPASWEAYREVPAWVVEVGSVRGLDVRGWSWR